MIYYPSVKPVEDIHPLLYDNISENNMSTKYHQVKNQTVDHTTGDITRRLVVDVITNHPRPVWRSDRSNGRNPSAGTYQQGRVGDIVIEVVIYKEEHKIQLTFHEVVSELKTIPVPTGFNFYPVINAITTLVSEWLYSANSEPFLPKGVGWDGETPEIEKIKMEKAWAVLPRLIPAQHLNKLSNAINYTSINVFNNIDVITLSKTDKVNVPRGDLIIQVDKENQCIKLDEPLYDGLTVEVELSEETHKLYILHYIELQGNTCSKLEVEVVEFV